MNYRMHFNLYATPPHECNYLPHHQATTVFIDPNFPKDNLLYDNLSQHGFRRSGEHLYRPHCRNCEECIPVRVPVRKFVPRRSQRRILQKNRDLRIVTKESEFEPEHFDLYCRYLATRHIGGGMDNPTPSSYMKFLTSHWSKTEFCEFRLKQQLVALAVLDHLQNGLSAVYTFFDPALKERSLGVYAILWEIEEAKRLKRDWLYLGYWIKGCRKMSYKIEYQPLEFYCHGTWQEIKTPNDFNYLVNDLPCSFPAQMEDS